MSDYNSLVELVRYRDKDQEVLFVVKLGPDCYKDTTRFPSGPSCKEGDFIIVRPNSGTRLKIHGRELRAGSNSLSEEEHVRSEQSVPPIASEDHLRVMAPTMA